MGLWWVLRGWLEVFLVVVKMVWPGDGWDGGRMTKGWRESVIGWASYRHVMPPRLSAVKGSKYRYLKCQQGKIVKQGGIEKLRSREVIVSLTYYLLLCIIDSQTKG